MTKKKKETKTTELDHMLNCLKALATTHNLLTQHVPYEKKGALEPCLNFLANLHEQMTEDALNHENADSVPELVDLKKKRAEAPPPTTEAQPN